MVRTPPCDGGDACSHSRWLHQLIILIVCSANGKLGGLGAPGQKFDSSTCDHLRETKFLHLLSSRRTRVTGKPSCSTPCSSSRLTTRHFIQEVAQPGRARARGARGHGIEARFPDHFGEAPASPPPFEPIVVGYHTYIQV